MHPGRYVGVGGLCTLFFISFAYFQYFIIILNNQMHKSDIFMSSVVLIFQTNTLICEYKIPIIIHNFPSYLTFLHTQRIFNHIIYPTIIVIKKHKYKQQFHIHEKETYSHATIHFLVVVHEMITCVLD